MIHEVLFAACGFQQLFLISSACEAIEAESGQISMSKEIGTLSEIISKASFISENFLSPIGHPKTWE